MAPILDKANRGAITQIYGVNKWVDYEDFLTQLAKSMGKLRKGGEADMVAVAKVVIMDWQRGRIPYFSKPPRAEGEEESKEESKLPKGVEIVPLEEAEAEDTEEDGEFELEDGESQQEDDSIPTEEDKI